MIITTINNNKLFIKFDSLIDEGVIYLSDHKNFELKHTIKSSDFEVLDLPERTAKIHIQIEIRKKRITKTINLQNQ